LIPPISSSEITRSSSNPAINTVLIWLSKRKQGQIWCFTYRWM
jgi:hypothetical protein